jgi:hypothetical protein
VGLDIGLETLSSGVRALDLSMTGAGRSASTGADGKRDDQRKLSTG